MPERAHTPAFAVTAEESECPLCTAAGARERARDRQRVYLACAACGLVFVPRRFHWTPAEQRQRYDLHRNNPDDPAYRAFLSALVDELVPRLPPGTAGIDYGCGPGPALAAMLTERGFKMAVYDPFYADDEEVLRRSYGFVACTEVVEHFERPREEWNRLTGLVVPGGWLGVMTQLVTPDTDFATWRYANDMTHVCFYADVTLRWIARTYGMEVELPRRQVAVFHKPARA